MCARGELQVMTVLRCLAVVLILIPITLVASLHVKKPHVGSVSCIRSRRGQTLLVGATSSPSAGGSALVSAGRESDLLALRNHYILESIVGIAKFSRIASRKLQPVKPLFKIADELKHKARVIIEAERQTNSEVKGLTSAERVIVSTLSLLTIWQRALVREMSGTSALLRKVKWGIESKLKWLVHLLGKSAKPAVSGTAGLFVLLADGWGPLYIIICALLNAALSKVIKKVLRLPRPEGSPKGGYGMPSSHAQTLFYFFTYLTLQLTGLVAQSQAKVDYFGVIPGGGSLPRVVNLGLSSVERIISHLGAHAPEVLKPILVSWQASAPPTLASMAATSSTVLNTLFSSQMFIATAPVLIGLYAISASLWRVTTKLHSLGQTAVGASLGSAIGYLAYTRQPSNMASFYEAVMAPMFGYALAGVRTPRSVPLKLKMYVLLVGFGLLYSKELKKWTKRLSTRAELVQTPAGIVKLKKHD